MSYTPYRDIGEKIRTREAFDGNSVCGRWEHGFYRVYSYSTIIFSIEVNKSGKPLRYLFNNEAYSRTTSKIQNLIISRLASIFAFPIDQAEQVFKPPYKRDGLAYLYNRDGILLGSKQQNPLPPDTEPVKIEPLKIAIEQTL